MFNIFTAANGQKDMHLRVIGIHYFILFNAVQYIWSPFPWGSGTTLVNGVRKIVPGKLPQLNLTNMEIHYHRKLAMSPIEPK